MDEQLGLFPPPQPVVVRRPRSRTTTTDVDRPQWDRYKGVRRQCGDYLVVAHEEGPTKAPPIRSARFRRRQGLCTAGCEWLGRLGIGCAHEVMLCVAHAQLRRTEDGLGALKDHS